jgi:hypothetical protein
MVNLCWSRNAGNAEGSFEDTMGTSVAGALDISKNNNPAFSYDALTTVQWADALCLEVTS